VIALGRDEKDACACTFEVQGTIEVHLLVLWLLRRWRLLGLRPLGDEIGEDMGLSNSPSSTDHLTICPTVSRLHRISPRGELETTLILCD
jgi:hypothetical protein